jgi:arylsulfatase A-like enzyme
MNKQNLYLATYTATIFFLLLAPGYSDIVDTIINMRRNTISFSSLQIDNILSSESIEHIVCYLLLALTLTCIFIALIISNSNYISKKCSHVVSPKIIKITLPILICIGCLQLNSLLFPNSFHAYPRLIELSNSHWIGVLLISIFIIGIMTTPISHVFSYAKKNARNLYIILASTTILTSIATYSYAPNKANNIQTQKNIFLISIDSFRADHMHDKMPFLSKKLENSTVFQNSFTPFARTFPSWSTILSGQYPANHGARYNLIDESLLNKKTQYLPSILEDAGYETIYASDERRFSQIGEYHGFKKIIGPRTGLANFLLGQYADFPLTNFLTLFDFGKTLMPDVALNRAASNLYSPGIFSTALNETFQDSISKQKPIFLSVHYCMPHWPFNHGRDIKNFDQTDEAAPGYHESLNTVDNQISELWGHLEKSNLISNSIIIFLSDHGETWQEKLSFEDSNGKEINLSSNGHGSNVISDNEHRVLTAFYNNIHYPKINTNKLTTLADIKPTVLGLINLDTSGNDGIDIFSNKTTPSFPVESGFKVSALTHKEIDINKAIKQSISRYSVKPNGTIRLKTGDIDFLNQGKIVGIRNIDQLLTYQKTNTNEKPSMLLLNYKNSTFEFIMPNKTKPHPMVKTLCNEYENFIPSTLYCN